MVKKNTGKPYENFVKDVYQAILRLHGINTISVKPSQPVAGTTLDEHGNPIEHEIDVHWEFEIDGTVYKTLIQAKDWAPNKVKKGHMIEFDAIVKDIPLSEGIFVAKSGFQKGAISWAKAKGIEAAELREPTSEEMKNRIQHIRCEFVITWSNLSGVSNFVLDEEWLIGLTQSARDYLFQPTELYLGEMNVEDEEGSLIDDLVHFSVDQEKLGAHTVPVTYTKVCDPPVFLTGVSTAVPRIKVKQFDVTVTFEQETRVLVIDAVMTKILRSVTGSNSYFVAEVDGELRAFLPNDMKTGPCFDEEES
ncbi:MAG: hypothetical protein C0508_01200 [Cyanobacteria bacterium PR.023]|nr:hypothetical protein [Cyanobacteria bacterium PR.3.49]MBA4073624.1 hypothetical protein [Cyanobacteria bacterium PR.023]